MSRIGAKASRARKEAKIREVVRLAIQEDLIPHWKKGFADKVIEELKRDPIREPSIVETITISGDTMEARLYLGFLTTTIALGIAYAFYSFFNP